MRYDRVGLSNNPIRSIPAAIIEHWKLLCGPTCFKADFMRAPPMLETMSPASRKKPRIIWVEDEEWLSVLLDGVIHAWFKEPEVVFFANGDDAWQDVSQTEPDLFLTDGSHTGMDGIELLKRLAAIKAKFPVVFTTALLSGTEARDISGLGLNLTILTKPFTPELFWAKVCLPLGQCENEDPVATFKRWGIENAERLK